MLENPMVTDQIYAEYYEENPEYNECDDVYFDNNENGE